MPRHKETGLTKLELQLMQVIWRIGPSTVSAVQEALEPKLAYTTVQTMLNILERKGKLKRQLQGRAFEYSAVVTEARSSTHALRDLIDRMFGGSGEDLVMSLIKNHQIDPEKLVELTERVKAEGEDAWSLLDSDLDAVRQWIYKPYLLNGNPTEVETTIKVNYNLSGY